MVDSAVQARTKNKAPRATQDEDKSIVGSLGERRTAHRAEGTQEGRNDRRRFGMTAELASVRRDEGELFVCLAQMGKSLLLDVGVLNPGQVVFVP